LTTLISLVDGVLGCELSLQSGATSNPQNCHEQG
jgi:hypothetical protein